MNILKELQVFNRVKFVEKTHTYLIDNQHTNNMSVTRLIKRFKRKFEKEKMAANVAKRTNTTVAQVLADWELNSLYSTTIGTMLHKYIENFYCNKRIEFDGTFVGLGFDEKTKIQQNFPKMVEHFQNFYEQNKNLICVKNEMVIGDIDDTKVCGTMDMLAYNSTSDKLEILDFKTNKKMEKNSKYASLFFPFDDMDECEVNEYTIQLNTYKHFIEKYTSLKIDKLKIIWLNPNNKDYQIIELDSIQDKIKLMLERFKASSLFEEQ